MKRPPRVQVLHSRDPDSSCDLRVWINGREVEVTEVCDVDPGAGHSREDWNDRIRHYGRSRSAFARACRAWLREAGQSPHIVDEDGY